MMTRELLQQALAALDYLGDSSDYDVSPDAWRKAKAEAACTAIRAHLAAQPAPAEPGHDCNQCRTQQACKSEQMCLYTLYRGQFPPAQPAPAEPVAIGKILSEAEMGVSYDRRMGDVIWWNKPAGPALIYAQPAPVPVPLTLRQIAEVTGQWADVPSDKTIGIARAAITKFCEVNGIAASPKVP